MTLAIILKLILISGFWKPTENKKIRRFRSPGKKIDGKIDDLPCKQLLLVRIYLCSIQWHSADKKQDWNGFQSSRLRHTIDNYLKITWWLPVEFLKTNDVYKTHNLSKAKAIWISSGKWSYVRWKDLFVVLSYDQLLSPRNSNGLSLNGCNKKK